VGRTVTPVGKPDAGNQHVRFDERGRETERALQSTATAPVLDSTKTKGDPTSGGVHQFHIHEIADRTLLPRPGPTLVTVQADEVWSHFTQGR
jgi:hypothetical protein